MIDILLVLIIMFLVITPTRSVGLNATVPQERQEAMPTDPPETVVIYAKGGGWVEVNHHGMAAEELPVKLMTMFQGRAESVVFVDGDKDLEFGEIARVIDVARGAGIGVIGLMPGRARL